MPRGRASGNAAVRAIDEKVAALLTARAILSAGDGMVMQRRGGARKGAGRPTGKRRRGRGRKRTVKVEPTA